MRMWLCNRKFTTVGEVLTKPLTASQVSIGSGGEGHMMLQQRQKH